MDFESAEPFFDYGTFSDADFLAELSDISMNVQIYELNATKDEVNCKIIRWT